MCEQGKKEMFLEDNDSQRSTGLSRESLKYSRICFFSIIIGCYGFMIQFFNANSL